LAVGFFAARLRVGRAAGFAGSATCVSATSS